MKNKCFRLRPSVSFVPVNKGMGRYDFFISNTRRTIPMVFTDQRLVEIVASMDGNHTIATIIDSYDNLGKQSSNIKFEDQVIALIQYLTSKCIIEDIEIAKIISNNPFRRVINFLLDYIPYNEIFDVWNRIQNSQIVIVGLGGMGSWISIMLSQSGFNNFVLIDTDVVNESNLNRSLFSCVDIGQHKTQVIAGQIKAMDCNAKLTEVRTIIDNVEQLKEILKNNDCCSDNTLVINCADMPNVDSTSQIIGSACMALNIPHIIAGGYNLHLSLIGPTIIPYQTACFECIRCTLDEKNSADLVNLRKLNRPKRNIGNLAPLTSISASFVVNEAIRIQTKSERITPAMINRRGEFNFFTNKINFVDLPKRSDCSWCGDKHK